LISGQNPSYGAVDRTWNSETLIFNTCRREPVELAADFNSTFQGTVMTAGNNSVVAYGLAAERPTRPGPA
jgi:hypothetical protein